ncbi:AlwI family type II restriction endonuclease [[Clostridium] polysaccharolyticum]|uniref:AlwI restriction endonuclease n=1 Tax=[Clostridium] polysaccharolyticum TaxID=29364 RepID=A0A1I0CL33_9FIRM|nr:AlwI family type II restriction endonuclease [[Clostridium] polysaccharolyticum]SET20182.1 AlwI restriction endonuclease [[Clostridium] polysaccharolyticum]
MTLSKMIDITDLDTLLIQNFLIVLMEGTTQRHGEMEPVSRHLANYMIDEDENAYCTFVSDNLRFYYE